MSPYPPGPAGCSGHIDWQDGDQYATFIAVDQAAYDAAVAARIESAANQGLELDGDPHNCPAVGDPDMYVVRLVPVE